MTFTIRKKDLVTILDALIKLRKINEAMNGPGADETGTIDDLYDVIALATNTGVLTRAGKTELKDLDAFFEIIDDDDLPTEEKIDELVELGERT